MANLLNESLGIENHIQFRDVGGGLLKAVLTHASGAVIELYNLGAHISSWRTLEQGELLFLSTTAELREGKAIRGGVPVIFPQFGPNGPLPSHGFARSMLWSFQDSKLSEAGNLSLTLRLTDTAATLKLWPHKFLFDLRIELSSSLSVNLEITNTGNSEFTFTTALHTYFPLSDISHLCILGLGPADFLDNTRGLLRTHDDRTEISIGAEVDRIYLSTPDKAEMLDTQRRRKIVLEKHQLPDSVLWNPWKEKGAALKDLEPDGYQRFFCLEAAAIEKPVVLAPAAVFRAEQILSVSDF